MIELLTARIVWDSRPRLIREARNRGVTWERIAAALGMSRAGVINLARTGV